MKTLTAQAFQNAKAYLFEQGRELEQTLFAYHFSEGARAPVLATLAAYQNEDGGFGRGLEPDLRTPASSSVATQQAFNVFRAVDTPSTGVLVRRAVDYLLRTFDPVRNVWPIIPPEAEHAPHAPWWNYAESAQNFGGFLANPRAALVGHLHDQSDLVPGDFLAQVTDAVVAQLEASSGKMEMHDLLCYVSLAETPNLPTGVKSKVQAKLLQLLPQNVALDPAQWTDYGLLPLNVVKAPDHFLAAVIPQRALAANLDFLIDQQQPDGAWAPAWNWAFVDEAAWQAAERDWKSHLTLATLMVLRAFGRME
ncbi:MAG: hypothetical protein U0350_26430 [Caldilineaceae bacterium]